MKTRLIGDVHGLAYELRLVLDNLLEDVTEVVQVGDMGVGFGQGDFWHESLDEAMLNANGSWVRGNHDNPSQCRKMSSWIPDGSVRNDWMFIGGAFSIDYAWRTPGVSWWEDEELSYGELDRIASIYAITKPRVVITHDFPTQAAIELFFAEGNPFYGRGQYKTRTASALQTMFEFHQPELWVAGHWHFDAEKVVDKTRFVCLNELSYVDVNRETLELEFHPLWRPI